MLGLSRPGAIGDDRTGYGRPPKNRRGAGGRGWSPLQTARQVSGTFALTDADAGARERLTSLVFAVSPDGFAEGALGALFLDEVAVGLAGAFAAEAGAVVGDAVAGVAFGAVGFGGVESGGCAGAAGEVFALRDVFEVSGVNAEGVTAGVVEYEAAVEREWSVYEFPGDGVGHALAALGAGLSVFGG